ncbi:hypothetical protein PUNSTDRAFT_94195, partial [Punctularia strigosozonata HHB-11173 SS5]|uniref:uncharacterized protein n=1 Tax=Punctularia strigosozonata (strain HHB-11173) TaxID=741275 RepID=UPI0004416B65
MPRTVKVAVIGSGLAGLTAAYMLSTEPPQGGVKFEVHLFEQSSTLGMDAHSVSIPTGGHGHESRIDVPMRSFQGGYYRRLIALYRHLGVRFRPTDFSYSFSFLTSDRRITTSLIYNGASGLRGLGIASSLRSSDKHNRPLDRLRAAASTYLSFALLCLLFLWNYVRLVALSAPAFRPRDAHRMSFRAWSDATVPRAPLARWLGLDAHWRAFTRDTLVPLFSAVCTASATDVLDHPAEEFLDYIWLTLFTHHYVASDGVRDVVARLAAPIHHVHLSS